MTIARPVILTLIAIAAIGWVLASLAPPHWMFAELFLLIGCVALVRECLMVDEKAPPARRDGAMVSLPVRNAWLGGSPADTRDLRSRDFHPWDFDQPFARPQPATARAEPRVTAATTDTRPRQSVEQIAHEMLMQAFRQASRERNTEDTEDPDYARRISAARELILRAIHRP